MNIGFAIVDQERQEAYERAMSRFRAHQARDTRRGTTRGASVPGRGLRRISKEEAIAKIAKTHPRSALKLLHEHFGGRARRGN
jgi:hypothetical protein